MPSLSAYKSDLDYSYAPGVFPSMECMLHRPGQVRRLLLHSSAAGREGADKLRALADKLGVRIEEADKALSRISGKENCFAAAVFEKFEDEPAADKPHVVLAFFVDIIRVQSAVKLRLHFLDHVRIEHTSAVLFADRIDKHRRLAGRRRAKNDIQPFVVSDFTFVGVVFVPGLVGFLPGIAPHRQHSHKSFISSCRLFFPRKAFH